MKLTHLILSGAVCFNLLISAEAQENYSLWPRRPAELEQARHLFSQHKWEEAAYLLQPFIRNSGIIGAEARNIVGRVNIARYLSRMHPYSSVYVVKRGDTLPKIAHATECPTDLLMLYNGLVAPSNLKVGQKLVFVHLFLHIEIYPALKEIAVWDKDILVASFKMISDSGISGGVSNPQTAVVSARESYFHGKKVPGNNSQAVMADKVIRLSDDTVISSTQIGGKKTILLEQKDMNELALLVREGNSVLWVENIEEQQPGVEN